jgi:hypothetical protein
MLASESRSGAHANSLAPLPGSLRVLLAVAIVVWTAAVRPAAAQNTPSGWTFEGDAFADLWFHGLSIVGFYGFGPAPLYDPAYALQARQERASQGLQATPLETERARFLAAFSGDDAFEVLHFVPVYFQGADRDAAMQALRAIARAPGGTPPVRDERARLGTQVVAQVLTGAAQRRTLLDFVEGLDEEWRTVVGPSRYRSAARREGGLTALNARWRDAYARPLASFLEAEGLSSGTAMVVAGLGPEGRFVPPSGPLARGPVVALGRPTGDVPVDAVLSSLVRELCYPAVRRAFAPFEARFRSRVEASRASDLAATRCGELLLEEHAPTQIAAYRTRFGLPQSGTRRGFLSASGRMAGAAAFEDRLEEALLRELNIHRDGARADALPVGRN